MDIGMVQLDSLSSATFPPRFCSDYTPPELRQDFAEPNQTIDTYAVGQILYRVFSGGNAPVSPADPPPMRPRSWPRSSARPFHRRWRIGGSRRRIWDRL